MFHHSVRKLLPALLSEFQRKLSGAQIMINPVNRQTVNVKPSAFLSDEFYGTLEKMQKTN